MSDFSPILVLQIKICIKPDRYGKGSNKIWEALSFWRNFFNNGAIWLQALICNRLNPRYEMQAVWLSIQRNHPFSDERLFLFELIDTFEKSQKQPKPLSRQIANPIVNKSIFFLLKVIHKCYLHYVSQWTCQIVLGAVKYCISTLYRYNYWIQYK